MASATATMRIGRNDTIAKKVLPYNCKPRSIVRVRGLSVKKLWTVAVMTIANVHATSP